VGFGFFLAPVELPQQENERPDGERPRKPAVGSERVTLPGELEYRDDDERREKAVRGPQGLTPRHAARDERKRDRNQREEGRVRIELVRPWQERIDLVMAGEESQRCPTRRGGARSPTRSSSRARRSSRAAGCSRARDRDEHGADEWRVEEAAARGHALVGAEVGEAREELQQQAEGAREGALLAHADPDDRRTFERPRRGSPTRVEGERDGERAKTTPSARNVSARSSKRSRRRRWRIVASVMYNAATATEVHARPNSVSLSITAWKPKGPRGLPEDDRAVDEHLGSGPVLSGEGVRDDDRAKRIAIATYITEERDEERLRRPEELVAVVAVPQRRPISEREHEARRR
jgi:hypothetical protein